MRADNALNSQIRAFAGQSGHVAASLRSIRSARRQTGAEQTGWPIRRLRARLTMDSGHAK